MPTFLNFLNIFYKNSVPALTPGLKNDFWSIHTSTKYSITWNQSHHGIESARDLGLLVIWQKWPKPSIAVMGLLRVYVWDPQKLPPLAISRLWCDAGLRNCWVIFSVLESIVGMYMRLLMCFCGFNVCSKIPKLRICGCENVKCLTSVHVNTTVIWRPSLVRGRLLHWSRSANKSSSAVPISCWWKIT